MNLIQFLKTITKVPDGKNMKIITLIKYIQGWRKIHPEDFIVQENEIY